jgi:lipopolysaccharide heptosyltransferase II
MIVRGKARSATRLAIRRAAFAVISLGGLFYRLRHPTVAPAARRVDRILIVRLDLLGDVLFTMPAVEAVRAAYPDAHIAMLTLPYTAPLARLYPFVDEVMAVDTNLIRRPRGAFNPGTWNRYRVVLRNLRNRRFDLGISMSGPMASLWTFLSGAGWTIGYEREAYRYLLTDPVPGGRHVERILEVEYAMRLARHAGAEGEPEALNVPVPETARRAVDSLLEHQGIHSRDRLVLIHAGSINGEAKRWPTGAWAEFVTNLLERVDVRIVLIGAVSDMEIAREVIMRSPRKILSLAGKTSVEQLIALIERADLLATGDSGPLHLAVAVQTPVLAVYGPTDPLVYGPFRPQAPVKVHRQDLPCSPCYTMAASAECPLGDPICMRLVTVSSMVRSAEDLLLAGAKH